MHPPSPPRPDPTGGVWTIVVAGGSGSRFGGLKQFMDLAGASVLQRSVQVAAAVSRVIVVAPSESLHAPEVTSLVGVAGVVPGGETRSASVRSGLAAVPAGAEVILVHDAARPLASAALFGRVIGAVRLGADVVVPTTAVVDSLREGASRAVDRERFMAVQTPQGFAAHILRSAHATGSDASDDATLAEQAGAQVTTVEGDRSNLKITDADDLAVATLLWTRGEPPPGSEPRGSVPTVGPRASSEERQGVEVPEIRVGNGFDIHRFCSDPDRTLVLGGVVFDGMPGLVGHSDGDVVAHACAEALLGAAGLGDLGSLFPDTDPAWAGADSMGLLAEVVGRVAAEGWTVGNVDCSIVTEQPKLAPARSEMQERLSAVVGAPVTVKGRRAEGVGPVGAKEAIVGLASAVITRTRRDH